MFPPCSLYEMASMPQAKMVLLSSTLSGPGLSAAIRGIDSAGAGCFKAADRALIHGYIHSRFRRASVADSLAALDRLLRLRFILRPLSQERDVDDLVEQSAADDFSGLEALVGEAERALERAGGGDSAAQCHLILAGSGEGKSSIAARLARLERPGGGGGGGASADPWVLSLLFCRAADARTRDPVEAARCLSFQIALRLPAAAAAVEALGPEAVAALRTPEEAVKRLVLDPLGAAAAAAAENREEVSFRPVILIDGLDEAEEDQGSGAASGALGNAILRLVASLREVPGLVVVASARPEPAHVAAALRAAFAGLREWRPAELANAGAAAAGALPRPWAVALARNARSKVFLTVSSALLRASLAAGNALAPPNDLDAAYAAAFALAPGGGERGVDLLSLLVAAQEPPTMAMLQELGFPGDELPALLPLWGTLFREQDFRVVPLHASLSEWLRRERPRGLNLLRGDELWQQFCHRRLAPGGAGGRYAARYAVRHCMAAAISKLIVGEPADSLKGLLLDFGFYEAAFREGVEYSVIADIADVRDRLVRWHNAHGIDLSRAASDAVRWLLANQAFLRADPAAALALAFAAPRDSVVRYSALQLGREPELELLNPPEREWPAEVISVEGAFAAVCFSPGGDAVLAGSGSEALVLRAATGQLVARLRMHAKPVSCCAWSGDGKAMATGSEARAPSLLGLSDQ